MRGERLRGKEKNAPQESRGQGEKFSSEPLARSRRKSISNRKGRKKKQHKRRGGKGRCVPSSEDAKSRNKKIQKGMKQGPKEAD